MVAGVADDMLDFLQEFMAAHPELSNNDLYITGESYAGHYVPAVSHRVWKYNKQGGGQRIPFKGLAIGAPRLRHGHCTSILSHCALPTDLRIMEVLHNRPRGPCNRHPRRQTGPAYCKVRASHASCARPALSA